MKQSESRSRASTTATVGRPEQSIEPAVFKAHAVITRHNPHPHRCVHICALQGCQVPSVVDSGMPLDFHICYPTARPEQLLAAAANPGSSLRGLTKPQHLEQFARLQAEAQSGSGAGDAAWRAALSNLVRETFIVRDGVTSSEHPNQTSAANPQQARQLQRLYSPLTGRLAVADKGNRGQAIGKLELLQDSVMSMLCRILQTQDRAAVRAWLVAASPRERQLVTDIIRSSVTNRDEYFVESALAACSICSGGGGSAFGEGLDTRLLTGSSTKSNNFDIVASKSSSIKSTNASSVSGARTPAVVELGADLAESEEPAPKARTAQVSPVPAAGKRTRLPSLLGNKRSVPSKLNGSPRRK